MIPSRFFSRKDRLFGQKSGLFGAFMVVAQLAAPYRRQLLWPALGIIGAVATLIGVGSFLRHLVDMSGRRSPEVVPLHFLFAGLLLAAALASASYLRSRSVSWLSARITCDLRQRLLTTLMHLPLADHERLPPGTTTNLLLHESTLLASVIGPKCAAFGRNLLLTIAGFIAAVMIAPRLSVLVFGLVAIVVLFLRRLGAGLAGRARVATQAESHAQNSAAQALAAVATIQSHRAQDQITADYQRKSEEALRATQERIKAQSCFSAVAVMLVFSTMTIVLWLAVQASINGALSPGRLTAFCFYILLTAAAGGSLGEIAAEILRASTPLTQALELGTLELGTQIPKPAPLSPPPAYLPMSSKPRLHCACITFAYPSRPEKLICDRLTLTIEPGQQAALIGLSGSGKTTLLRLLLGLYIPQSGQIFLDDIDLTRKESANPQQFFAFIPQEPAILPITAAENLRLANPDATQEQVRQAAQAAAILPFLEALPQGLETPLTAAALSPGQKQRIAIARAILHEAPILLLDEPGSALDRSNAQATAQALAAAAQGRSSLLVSHHQEIVKLCDPIFLLHHGKIVAQGSYRHLIAHNALAAELLRTENTKPK